MPSTNGEVDTHANVVQNGMDPLGKAKYHVLADILPQQYANFDSQKATKHYLHDSDKLRITVVS